MKIPWQRWLGTVYRAHNPRWAYDPESGAGASVHGGRFNPPGQSTLYTSLSPETTWLEAQQGFPFKAQPLTLCGYAVDCERVVDLTQEKSRRAAGVSLAELSCAWEALLAPTPRPSESVRKLSAGPPTRPPSWVVAQKLYDAGTAAIIVPSFANRAGTEDLNMVFWRWGRVPPYQLQVIDDLDRLPRNDSSWR